MSNSRSRSRILSSSMPGILPRPAAARSHGFALLRHVAVPGAQEGSSFHLVHAAPDPMGVTGAQGELQAGLTHRAANAEGLRDRLAGVLLGSLLEVGRSEEVGRVLPPADGPLPPRSEGRVHLPGCSRAGSSEIPVPQPSRELHTGRGRRKPDQSLGAKGSDSGSTLSTSPSTPRTRTRVPVAIGSPRLRPRQSAPLTNTGPSGAIFPRASPIKPISPRWVETIRSREAIATVRPNPKKRKAAIVAPAISHGE